jgi:hypothetical protein
MKQLATSLVTKELDEGTIVAQKFQIRDEEKEYEASKVSFKVLDVRNKLIARDPDDALKVTNETVFFDGVKKDAKIPDKLGGNACGRTFPSWEGVKEFSSAEQQKQKKIAGWYTCLFGEVTFPGKSPVLVNYRLTPRQAMQWGDIQKTLGRDRSTWGKNILELSVTGMKDKPQFAEVSFKVKESNASLECVEELHSLVLDFINKHNDEILKG